MQISFDTIHHKNANYQLESIKQQFQSNQKVCLKQTIAGLGGVGKTQIAIEYAHRFSDMYTDAIWWMNAETENTLFNSCLSFAKESGLLKTELPELNAHKLGALLKDWQRKHNSWLFIFDNVENEAVVKPYISQSSGQGHILFTSRKHNLRELGVVRPVDVNVFSFKEALGFMQKRIAEHLKLIGNDVELVALINRLGCFPLALEQAAAYMELSGKDCRKYLALLNEKGLPVFEQRLSSPITDYKRTLLGTFSISYNTLQSSAQQLFNLCAYMASDDIPLNFFERQRKSLPSPLCDALTDICKFDAVVAELLNYSLVSREGDFLNVHRFVQEIGREQLREDKIDWLGICMSAVIAEMPVYKDFGVLEYRERFKQIGTHAVIIAACADKTYTHTVDVDKMKQIASLYYNLGVGGYHLAQYRLALEWYGQSLDIREKTLGKDHPDTATTYNNIAQVYDRQGRYELALKWYLKALDIREKTLGKDHPDTATTYNNIGLVYKHNCRYELALKWYLKALDIREKTLDTEHPDTATTYNNIAQVYRHHGKYELALEWYNKALTIKERVLGKDHIETATTYHDIAYVYATHGKYELALEWYNKALTIQERVLGKDHPFTATTYHNIAGVYDSQGRHELALEWYGQSLDIREKILDKDHPDTATVYNNIAYVYANQGMYELALEWYTKSYQIFSRLLGNNHPNTLTVKVNMETVYAKAAYVEPFEDYLQKCLIDNVLVD